MPDQSSIHTVIVLEFNPAEELIDSEIIAVHRIVSNMKKKGGLAGGQKGGCSRALDRWWTVVRNSYGVSRVNETREEKERMISRERNDLKLMSLSQLGRVGVSRAAPRMHKGFPTLFFFYCASSPVSSKRVVFPRTISRRTHKLEKEIIILIDNKANYR